MLCSVLLSTTPKFTKLCWVVAKTKARKYNVRIVTTFESKQDEDEDCQSVYLMVL